ncbi:MAG: hypothetical protein IJ874_09250 [Ruminococcus sp.]|nr:hypothetical protein [Ruminococcus sp.]
MAGVNKLIKCTGEGQGQCRRCSEKGKWNRAWMSFLYQVVINDELKHGVYCYECAQELLAGATGGIINNIKEEN